ncbi:MAG: (2Fe-2S)-binding protein [Deltaproteobacteria bacterium]|nr:MAG: (2Fe-2S)-binding protein [Deltaproteobacteria bacterium]
MIEITINDQTIEVEGNKTILEVALDAEIYIPHLCYHPQLDSSSDIRSLQRVYQGGLAHYGQEGAASDGCNLCLVEIQGREGLFQSCKTIAEDGMSVHSDSDELQKAREENLATILERHPHGCLLCAQAKGCDRKICSLQVPEAERCCFKFGFCELQKVAEFIGLEKGLPPYNPLNVPVVDNEPLFIRDYNLCIGCLRCVKVCKEVKGADALGFTIEEGRVVVGSKEPSLRESGCQFCGFCVAVCPTGALADKVAGIGKPETYLIPCKSNCPVGIDIPRYTRLIAEGKFGEAVAVIRERVPFPGVLGYVCYHPCETVCRRGELDEAIAICELKGFAAKNDTQVWKKRTKVTPSTGKRVAIIGSGPAGLTAAHYLVKLGHSVTVFEALPEVGGMMRVGISEKTLPREMLDEEIEVIRDLGVQIETKTKVDSLDDLFEQGYSAIFIAVGAPHKEFNQVLAEAPDTMKKWGLQGTEGISIEVDIVTLATSREGVFAGGDIVRGPALVKMRRAT